MLGRRSPAVDELVALFPPHGPPLRANEDLFAYTLYTKP